MVLDKRFLFAAAACVSVIVDAGGIAEDIVAQTDCGKVRGVRDEILGYGFFGIPYAVPPLRPNRWQRSKLLSEGGGCWGPDTILNASVSGPVCVQIDSNNETRGEEDCLTLDIWTAGVAGTGQDPSSSRLAPVLVYIHGGSLETGKDPALPAFTGQDVVIVGIKYRINVFGFLSLAALSSNDPLGVSGNYGFSDQITALRWVSRNIASFGGNPNAVTIMGCSSGGSSVWALLTSPLAKGLFHRAIPLSGASRNNVTLAAAERANEAFVTAVGCSKDKRPNWLRQPLPSTETVFDCLQGLDRDEVVNGYNRLLNSFPFWKRPFDFKLPSPAEFQCGVCVVDGVVVAHPLEEALANASLHATGVPLLVGTNSQEGDTGVLPTTGATVAQFKAAVATFVAEMDGHDGVTFPADAALQIGALYPPASDEFRGDPKAAMDAIAADIRVVCGNLENSRRVVAAAAGTRWRSSQGPEAMAQPGPPVASVDVWHIYTGMNATSGSRAGHCYQEKALATKKCAVEPSPCASADLAFHHNMVGVVMSFVANGTLPTSLRRFGDVPPEAAIDFDHGGYVVVAVDQRLVSISDRLKSRCDFWRQAGVLTEFPWNE